MRRIFIACTLPETIGRLLDTASEKLAADCLSLRRVPAHNRHLTLRFLGEVSEEDYRRVLDLFDSVQPADFGIYELSLCGYGHFRGRDGLTVWAGVKPAPALYALVRAYEQGLISRGFEAEKKQFKPHITLARKAVFRQPPDYRTYPVLDRPLAVPAVILWQSRLSSKGPSYEALAVKNLSP